MRLILIALLASLAACNSVNPDNPSILRYSEGELAGAVTASIFGGSGEFCQLTSSDPNHVWTEKELEFMAARCPTDAETDDLIVELLAR